MLRFCSKRHHLKDTFLYFYVNTIFEISGFTTKQKSTLCMLHFSFSSAAYEPKVIVFFSAVITILQRGNSDICEGKLLYSFSDLCVLQFLKRELKTNFSVNFDNLPPSVFFLRPPFFFPFSKLPLLNPRAQMSRISGDVFTVTSAHLHYNEI